MAEANKLKGWIGEKAPALAALTENKYVGMIYDRFASLPAKQQRQLILSLFGGVAFIVITYLLWSYISYWSIISKNEEIFSMSNMLLQYQKQQRDRSPQIQSLNKNQQLNVPGQLKQFLMDVGRNAGISNRMIQVEDRAEAGVGEENKGKKEIKIKQATATLQRINLTQLTSFLKGVEFGKYNLSVSSVKINNDDKLRGYLGAEVTVMAYLFENDEG